MIRQKKLKVENFLTDIIRQFSNRNKHPPQASKNESIEVHITAKANPYPLFAQAGRGPTRDNHNQDAIQPNSHQYTNQ